MGWGLEPRFALGLCIPGSSTLQSLQCWPQNQLPCHPPSARQGWSRPVARLNCTLAQPRHRDAEGTRSLAREPLGAGHFPKRGPLKRPRGSLCPLPHTCPAQVRTGNVSTKLPFLWVLGKNWRRWCPQGGSSPKHLTRQWRALPHFQVYLGGLFLFFVFETGSHHV